MRFKIIVRVETVNMILFSFPINKKCKKHKGPNRIANEDQP